MPFYDLPLDQLYSYKPESDEPSDFDQFWQNTLQEAAEFPIDCSVKVVDTGLVTLDFYDVTFRGYAGQEIRAWLVYPHGNTNPLPCVVEFGGYGGGRGYPLDHLIFASAGYAHFFMDTRGQGSIWRRGDTPDISPLEEGPFYPGYATRGIFSPQTYYYRRLIVDAVRAVDAVKTNPKVDPQKLFVSGFSQGGGLALAVSALRNDINGCTIDFPFLCHIRRACQMVMTTPYTEIANLCKLYSDRVEDIFATLSYFDGMNLASRATCRALFSVGLMDDLCPPSTVFATYNHYAGPKSIQVYEFSQHDAGGTLQVLRKLEFLHTCLS